MPRRPTEDVLREFHHLYGCIAAFMDAEDPMMPPETIAIRRELPISRENMIAAHRTGPATASQPCAGTRQTARDLREHIPLRDGQHPVEAERLRGTYRATRGRNHDKDLAMAATA